MIRVVYFAIAMIAVCGVASADVKKPGATKCDWAFEVFKTKIGETCQKDLLGKLKSEQDKIFAQRVFKNWQPLTGYDIQLDDGLIHLSNTKDDDFLEIHWISIEPAIAIINGVVVSDEVKDDSMYRRMERMLKKADEEKVAMGFPSRRHRLPLLLLGEEAEAKSHASVDDAAFIFTIDGRTGSAEDLVERGAIHAQGRVTPQATNFLTKFFSSKKQIQCQVTPGAKGRQTIVKLDETIGGRKVTIESMGGSRTKFMVNGYPNPDSHTLVNFEAGQGAMDPYVKKTKLLPKYYTDKHGKKHRRKNRGGRTVYYYPCSGLYNADLDDSCGTLWREMAEDPAFPEVKEELAKFADDAEIRWGKDVRCEKIYKEITKLHECNQYFGRHFQKENRRFSEGQSKLAACRTADAKRCNGKIDEVDLEGQGPVESGQLRKFEIGGMQAYAAAWNKDRGLVAKKPEAICPALASSEDEQLTRGELPPCEKPPKEAGPQVQSFWKEMSKGNLNVYAKVRGSEIRRELEQKVLGAMVLGECCNSETCAQKLEDNAHIKLEGAKTAQ